MGKQADELRETRLAWDNGDGSCAVMDFCEDYKRFLNAAKTERETFRAVRAAAEAAGFRELGAERKTPLQCGDRVYVPLMGKAIALFVLGSAPLEQGMNLVAAHLDSPRLDLKVRPLYESGNLALFKTHYYGGVKKYQWGTTPLALHGVAVKKDGQTVEIVLGETEEDPAFYISDLPIHIAAEQMDRKLSEGLTGEEMNVICGSVPVDGASDADDRIRCQVMRFLDQRYGIGEEDFTSAELEIVPAGHARDVGFDRGLIAAYGHDDRVCVYTALQALLAANRPERTAVGLFVDKEEIGSVGATGMESRFFENAVAEVLDAAGVPGDLALRRTLARSRALSADVVVALDPSFQDSWDLHNAATLGGGMTIEKFVGHRGKKGSNDANAEYLAQVRRIFDERGVTWQTGEQGKIDLGGGGTISYRLSVYGMAAVDCGVPLLSMHAPYELASKTDVYQAYRGYLAFYEMQ